MKKLFSALLLAFTLYANISFSDLEYFRSVTSGEWTNGSTWEVSTNGGINWFNSALYPNYNSGYTELRGGHNVTVPVNASVTCNQFTIRTGGTLTVLTGGTVTTIADGSFYDLNLESGSTVTGTGYIQTTGIYGGINISTGCNFNAPLRIVSGELKLFDAGSTLFANVRGDITVNSGATLYVSGYLGVKAFANVLNNGLITGTSPFYMKGISLINNGTINTPYFYFDTATAISGINGNWNSTRFIFSSSGNVKCGNDIIFTGGTGGCEITLKSGAILNPNEHIFTTIGLPAQVNMIAESGSTIQDSGSFQTIGTVEFDIQTGSNFNLPLKVKNGILYNYCSTSPNITIFNDSVTIDSGTVFSPLSGYTAKVYGTVRNNGEISGIGSNFIMKGNNLINNGIIDTYTFNFDSTTALSGSGSFLTSFCRILSGANVTLTSSHQFRYININAGGSFDITSKTLKLNGSSDPLINNGAFTTAASTIEYNGTFVQYFPQLNVDYVNVNFNNLYGFQMLNNATVSGLVQVLSGDINLNTHIFTLQPTATLSETPGNTVFGDYGYLITTRNLNAPVSLNVGGMGATITTTTNLGSTVIKRGHSIQNLPNGFQSVQRYFEIIPTNNSILNGSMVFNYDDSELNGITESGLSLFNSTNSGSSYNLQTASLNTTSNTLSLSGITSFSKYTAGPGSIGYINLSASIEGLYNISTSKLNISDTLKVYLRNTYSPYSIIDSAKAKLDSVTLTANLAFMIAPPGIYFIEVRNRNSIETWSKTGQNYYAGYTFNYDFTNSKTKAFGDNMTLKGVKWAFYSGDINQDGNIDLSDVLLIYNDASNFTSGYKITDLNGDYTSDLSDILIAYNNSNNFVSRIIP